MKKASSCAADHKNSFLVPKKGHSGDNRVAIVSVLEYANFTEVERYAGMNIIYRQMQVWTTQGCVWLSVT